MNKVICMEVVVMIVFYLMFILGLFLVLYGIVTLYYQAKYDKQKYKLYKVRDKLVNFAIEGKIDKDLFTKLYKIIDDISIEKEEENVENKRRSL